MAGLRCRLTARSGLSEGRRSAPLNTPKLARYVGAGTATPPAQSEGAADGYAVAEVRPKALSRQHVARSVGFPLSLKFPAP